MTMLRDDGHPDFHALRSKRGCRDACLMTFDLLGLDGSSLLSLPLHARRAQLAALIVGQVDALLFSGQVAGSQGEALFRHACALGLEGIVSKKAETVIGLARESQDRLSGLLGGPGNPASGG